MANTDLAVRIATVLDSTGLKKADKGIVGLEKRAKSLGKSLGVALSVTAVVAFGKAAVKAFAEDERAATNLANVIDNLGLSFANPRIANFITTLSKTAAVADDELRPAMQKLLTTTGSVDKSMALLTQAIDISRGSGVDLATVVSDLSAAYVGNLKGLKKYNLGLTQAELSTMTFSEIQAKLLKQFSGSNAKFLTTYAGKMQALSIAAGEAKETIGKGLIDALIELSGSTDVQDLIGKIDTFAQGLADTLVYVGKLMRPFIKGLEVIFKYLGSNQQGAAFGQGVTNQFKKNPFPYGNNGVQGYKETKEDKAAREAAAKAEAAAAKRARELAASLKKNTAELKRQALTKKQSALFDMEQIQIVAALKGKISAEEKLRLELQLALITGNEKEADKLSQKLANTIDSTGNLAKYLTTLPDANNPFKNWDAYLDAIEKRIRELNLNPPGSTPTNVPSSNVPAYIPDPAATQTEINRERGNMYGSSNVGVISVQIDGKEIAKALQDQSMSAGQVAYLNRRTGNFD